MNVTRWMTRTLITCRPEHSLQHVAALCWEHDLGVVPVVDAEGRLLGMITDRDLCMAAFTRGSALAAHPVETAMARKLYTLSPKDSIQKAHELFRAHQLRRLPVVDAKGVLVGMLTLQDIARKSTTELGRSKRKPAAVAVTETLAAIAKRRAVQASAVPTPAPAAGESQPAAATKSKSKSKAVLAPARSSKKSAARMPATRTSKSTARRAVAKSRS